MALGGLYCIEVAGVGNYWGESSNIPRRWATHRKQLYNGRHRNIKLRRLWLALGPEAFTFRIIEQNVELTKNKTLRKMKESLLIAQDPYNLNTLGSSIQCITKTNLPNKLHYRNRYVIIERSTKGMAWVKSDESVILGIECIEPRFKAGRFFVNNKGELSR